jgi:hypothetical protein
LLDLDVRDMRTTTGGVYWKIPQRRKKYIKWTISLVFTGKYLMQAPIVAISVDFSTLFLLLSILFAMPSLLSIAGRGAH